jgi:hypothetical protein
VADLHGLYSWIDEGNTYVAPNRLDVVYEPALYVDAKTAEEVAATRAREHVVEEDGFTYRQVRCQFSWSCREFLGFCAELVFGFALLWTAVELVQMRGRVGQGARPVLEPAQRQNRSVNNKCCLWSGIHINI